MTTPSEEPSPGPLELLESARTKYQLALARLRRGSTELALLSLHGAIEDVLRGHGLRLQLSEAYESFAQLLDGLTTVRQQPLSAAEAEGIRRMHRLRARVAHGEQIVVTRETIDAYQRLAARLLPRYGVMVVGPEDALAGTEERLPSPSTVSIRRDRETLAALSAEPAPLARRGDTARIEREAPRRERTVYPDSGSATYLGRARPSRATADLPLAREWSAGGRYGGQEGVHKAERQAAFWSQAQSWLLPALAILSIFLIGAVISVSLQQLRAEPPVPTAALPEGSRVGATPFQPQITTAAPADGAISGAPAAPSVVAAPAAPGAIAPGRTAYVTEASGGLNVRAQPGTAPDNQIVFSLAPGTAVEVIGGPANADGFVWWQVRGPTGEGWCAGQYLELR
jgi:hypothetical protein